MLLASVKGDKLSGAVFLGSVLWKEMKICNHTQKV